MVDPAVKMCGAKSIEPTSSANPFEFCVKHLAHLLKTSLQHVDVLAKRWPT
jgi:hypothetical protein